MLNKISLKRRLWLSLVLLWTVILLCTAVGIKGLLDTQKSLRLIHEDRMGTMSLLQDITANFDDTRSSVFRAFQHDPNHDLHLLHNHGVRQHTDTIRENRKHNIGFRERLNNRQVNEFEAELRSNVFTALNAWHDQLDAVVEGIDRNEYSNRLMLLFLTAMENEGLEVQNSIKKLSNYQIDQANEASSFAQRQLSVSLLFFALLYAFLALPATDMQLSLTKLISGIREGSDKIETDIGTEKT